MIFPLLTHDLPDVINNSLINIISAIPVIDTIKLDEIRPSCGPLPNDFIIEEHDVFLARNWLKLKKAIDLDCIPNKILKHFSYTLAAPICAIVNSSYRQGIVPDQWKISRIAPLPKCFPVKTVENDIRPIAITNTIAKIAESLIGRFFNEYLAPLLDTNQFGCAARKSTTHALIKLTDESFKASDNSDNFIRILFLDFSKAFDFINHNVLLEKFLDYNFPPPYHCMVFSFFTGLRTICFYIGNKFNNTQI